MEFSIFVDHPEQYWNDFLQTIQASTLGLIGSFFMGTFLALFRLLPISFLNKIARFFMEWIQYIPLFLFVFFFYVGLPALGFSISGFMAGTIGLCIYTGALMGEVICKGIQSIPKGQVDVALATGLTYVQALRYVVLPQAIKNILPNFGNQLINLIKNSSILGVVAGIDIMYHANLMYEKPFDFTSAYLIFAIFYLLLTIPLSLFVGYLERRWTYHRQL